MTSWADLRRVLALWRPRAPWLWAGAAVGTLAALSALALLALAGQGVAAGIATATGTAALLWLRPLVLVRPLLRWSERMVTHAATFRALADTRIWFFSRLAERLPGGLGLRSAGDLLGRLVTDVEALDGLYLRALVPAATAIAVVLAIAALLGAHPLLLAAVALPLALALLAPLLLVPASARAAAAHATAQGQLRAAVVDPLSGLEDTLAATAEPRAASAVAGQGAALAGAQRRLQSHASFGAAAGLLLARLAMLAALAWGLATGAATPALLALFLVVAATESLAAMPRAGASLAAAAAAARRLFEAADTPPPVAEPATPAELPAGHALRLEDLSFRWAADRPQVFEHLSLDIPEGSRIAILGASGAGKSSLSSLLLKLAAPNAGRITLGGTDIATLAAEDVRHRIACLTQDARLFDDSIAANLRIAAPLAPDAALWRALDRAGIGDLVRALPAGLATPCGEAGARFSGGQARRLALARVLLSATPIVILDEPTAGLDAATERAFLATLEEATAGRTVLLLTHRLTGAERLTRVLRLAGGRVLAAAG